MGATDILFVNLPPYESYYAEGVPHLGMLYVMTMLRQHGYTVSYLDCSGRRIRRQQIVDRIKEASPRLVGFSIDTDNLFCAAHLSHQLKKELGERVPIVLGGPASQGQADEIVERCAADVLVIGEGEYTACEVADYFLRDVGSLAEIAGICYRSGARVVHTAPRDPIEDLDRIPYPDRDFLGPRRYEASLISGRGCPFRCTFCFEGRMGNKYRHRSPENILGEFEYLITKYERPFISINDDTFTADPEHTLTLCRLLRERFQPWRDYLFFCEVRVDVIDRHPALIDALVEAGAARIQIGAESADPDMLRAYKRLNVKPGVVERVVGRFHRAGLPSIYCGFIVGGPHETTETLERTFDFARHLLVDVAPGTFECNASFLTPLPGTEIRRHPEKYGLRLLDSDLVTSSNFNYCVAETEALDRAAINNFRSRFYDEMDVLVRQLIPTLPRTIIERHSRLQHEFNVITYYAERFGHFPRLLEYLNVTGEGKFAPASTLSDFDLLERFPTRLAGPFMMDGDRIIVTRGPTLLTLNGMGSEVFALCSGKLNTGEIVERLSHKLGDGAPDREVLQSDVIRFVRHLDENYAIFLKDF